MDETAKDIVFDDEGRIVDVNAAMADLMGLAHDEAIGFHVRELVPDEPFDELWEVFNEQGEMAAEIGMVRPDGARRQIEFVATANVRPGKHIAVVRDLTHQKDLE